MIQSITPAIHAKTLAKKRMANVRLTKEMEERLETLGKARDRSPHYLMKTAIERFLDVEEAIEAERQLVASRWEKFEITGEVLDQNEVEAWANDLSADQPKTKI